MILFHLPMPPSVNNLYVNVRGRGRVKSQRYLTWLRAATNDVLAQSKGQTSIRGPVKIMLTCGRPDKRRRDVTNLIKSCEDLMVATGMIDDDHLTESAILQWGDVEGCEIRIWAAADVSFRAVDLAKRAA